MAASTINIAEFRFHPLNRRAANPRTSDAHHRPALRVVEPDAAELEPESTNPPGVYNIAAARERHSQRGPALYRPFPFRHRANLVRFDEPHVTVMRAPECSNQMAAVAADERDFPPAA